jgi:hypothetical protein
VRAGGVRPGSSQLQSALPAGHRRVHSGAERASSLPISALEMAEAHHGVVLRAVFDEVDKDGSGSISHEELVLALQNLKLDDSQAAKMLREADADGDGTIEYLEFTQAMTNTFDSSLWLEYRVCDLLSL